MAITAQTDLNFSDQRIRPAADQLSRAYRRAVSLISRWTALGSGAAALAVMSADIRFAASALADAFAFCELTERIWFLGINTDFSSNDGTAVSDGSPGDGRPTNTTAAVNGVMNRVVEVQNWLLSVAGSFTAIPQVETATAVGTIGTSGNATVIVTANQMTGTPRTVSVAVTSGDTAAVWAGKVRTALATDSTVNVFFAVSGAGTSIVLTALTAAANDLTMNVSLANGTNTGITAAPNSANTTAGVAVRGGLSWMNTVLQASNYGPVTLVLSDAQNFINRCTEMKTNYEANSSANLNTILALAVNPNPNP